MLLSDHVSALVCVASIFKQARTLLPSQGNWGTCKLHRQHLLGGSGRLSLFAQNRLTPDTAVQLTWKSQLLYKC